MSWNSEYEEGKQRSGRSFKYLLDGGRARRMADARLVQNVSLNPRSSSTNCFDDLDPKSVDSFKELSQKFLEEFSQRKRYAKDPTEIHGIKRRKNEGLQAFMDRDRGHNTNDYYQLKKQIEEAVASGKLAHLVKNIRRNNQKNGSQGKNNVKVINMIRGGGNCKRPFEGERSSSEIMYEHCFRNLSINIRSRLRRCRALLIGFLGETYHPLGVIDLRVTMGEAGRNKTALMEFIIVKFYSPYNVIIGRNRMRILKAVGSTIYSMIKFPTNQGIMRIETSREALWECRQLERVQGSWKEDDGKGLGQSKRAKRGSILGRNSGEKKNRGRKVPQTFGDKGRNRSRPGKSAGIHPKPHPKRSKPNMKFIPATNNHRQRNKTISSVLMVEREGVQEHVSYVSRPLQGMKICYTPTEKMVQALIHTTRSLRITFRKHKVTVVTDGPMDEILKLFGREGPMEEISKERRPKFFGQGEQVQKTPDANEGETSNLSKKLQAKLTLTPRAWRLYLGKKTIKEGSGVGIILVSPDEKMHSYAIRLKFNASDHAMDCEALLAGLVAFVSKGLAVASSIAAEESKKPLPFSPSRKGHNNIGEARCITPHVIGQLHNIIQNISSTPVTSNQERTGTTLIDNSKDLEEMSQSTLYNRKEKPDHPLKRVRSPRWTFQRAYLVYQAQNEPSYHQYGSKLILSLRCILNSLQTTAPLAKPKKGDNNLNSAKFIRSKNFWTNPGTSWSRKNDANSEGVAISQRNPYPFQPQNISLLRSSRERATSHSTDQCSLERDYDLLISPSLWL
ncbi:hypothetical protein Tco_0683293 [Tanacetum coccineum]|uniref:Reverse transcriptase RNase H-like domain-containing protein n=1 Tax=Tanacetum coccineum TaxID=301880 RepID=A0ABQ4XTK6_9ASTR